MTNLSFKMNAIDDAFFSGTLTLYRGLYYIQHIWQGSLKLHTLWDECNLGRIHLGASGRGLVRDKYTSGLCCSLRSRPQAASRPSASRMPGVSKITTGMLLLHKLHQIYSILFQILDKKACTTIQTDCWFRLQDPTIFIFTFITTSPNLITII